MARATAGRWVGKPSVAERVSNPTATRGCVGEPSQSGAAREGPSGPGGEAAKERALRLADTQDDVAAGAEWREVERLIDGRGHRAKVAGAPVVEDLAVRGKQPVAPAVGRGGTVDDRPVP